MGRQFFSRVLFAVLALYFAGCGSGKPEGWMSSGNAALGIPCRYDQLVERDGYTLGYSHSRRQALWVSYILKAENLQKTPVERTNVFQIDPLIKVFPVHTREYTRTGYDRGHLAPAADMAYSAKAMSDSFYMSNISPQLPECNRKHWLAVEKMVRVFALRENLLYVVTGPYFGNSGKCISQPPITVPQGFFKAVMDLTPPYKMIAFYVPNVKRDGKMQILSVDELEKLTGYDFFSELDDRMEEKLESAADITAWEKDKK